MNKASPQALSVLLEHAAVRGKLCVLHSSLPRVLPVLQQLPHEPENASSFSLFCWAQKLRGGKELDRFKEQKEDQGSKIPRKGKSE